MIFRTFPKSLIFCGRHFCLSQKIGSKDLSVYRNNPNLVHCQNERLLDQIQSSQCMRIFEDFINEEEEQSLVKELDPLLKRLIYEQAHWDDAIHGYRETERAEWSTPLNETIISRIRQLAFPPGKPQLQRVHILDLKKSGVIKPHVDSVKFCGDTIAGLSLLSGSIMRLVRATQVQDQQVQDQRQVHPEDKAPLDPIDCLLPRRSLYIMTGPARYDFTHEILANDQSIFKGQQVLKGRRISVICRSEVTDKPPDSK